MVSELELKPEGKEPLIEFVDRLQPKNQQQEILVIAYYLQEIAEVSPVTVSHVFTCFRTKDNLRLPVNLPQAIRNTSNRKGWIDCKDQYDLKVPTLGINFVEHDLENLAATETNK